MNNEVNGTFIYNGQPQNGATAKLWQITGFASYADSTDEVENNPLEAWETELVVNNGALFDAGDIIRIQTENLRVIEISGTTLYVVRGVQGTAPAQHILNTQIDDQTITEPAQDDSEPAGGYQQGASINTEVAYGGDGAYRWTGVPEGEYYISIYYDNHRAFLYVLVVRDDPTVEQVLTDDGDLLIHNADRPTRLEKGVVGRVLAMGANRPEWSTLAGALIAFPNTEVFDGSGNTPNAFTELDMSAVVGANSAVVLLRIYEGVNDAGTIAFRKNGEAVDSDKYGCAGTDTLGASSIIYLIIVTDNAGKVEWKCQNTVLLVTVTVEAYIK